MNIIVDKNKCCLKDSNMLVIQTGWSYFCKECGRYCYDSTGWSRGITASIKKAKEFLFSSKINNNYIETRRLNLIFKKIKGKRFKKWYEGYRQDNKKN